MSAVYDPGATTRYNMKNYGFTLTDEQQNKVLHMPKGTTPKESVK